MPRNSYRGDQPRGFQHGNNHGNPYSRQTQSGYSQNRSQSRQQQSRNMTHAAGNSSNSQIDDQQRARRDKKDETKRENEKANFLKADQITRILNEAQAGNGSDPLFICIDLELYEFHTNEILELGMAVFDSLSIKDIKPEDRAEAWIANIEYHHLLIEESSYVECKNCPDHGISLTPIRDSFKQNGRYCPGHPDKFLFGKTTTVPLKDVAARVEDIIATKQSDVQQPRQIVLVGHAFDNDNKTLKKLAFKSWPPAGFYGTVDTQKLATERVPERFPNQSGLGKILSVLGIPSAYLHNGGNDAAFTLQAMLALISLTPEQVDFLSPLPPTLGAMKRSWEGDIQPHDPEPKQKRQKTFKRGMNAGKGSVRGDAGQEGLE